MVAGRMCDLVFRPELEMAIEDATIRLLDRREGAASLTLYAYLATKIADGDTYTGQDMAGLGVDVASRPGLCCAVGWIIQHSGWAFAEAGMEGILCRATREVRSGSAGRSTAGPARPKAMTLHAASRTTAAALRAITPAVVVAAP